MTYISCIIYFYRGIMLNQTTTTTKDLLHVCKYRATLLCFSSGISLQSGNTVLSVVSIGLPKFM